ncbi:MAG: hypothetical protein AAF488_14115 [Planctomycetota bacterium]
MPDLRIPATAAGEALRLVPLRRVTNECCSYLHASGCFGPERCL